MAETFKTPRSILRTGSGNTPSTPVMPTTAKLGPGSSRRKSVHFEPPPNLGDILQRNATAELEGFLTHMKNQSGASLVTWIEMLIQNINALKPKVEAFVIAVLGVPWPSDSEAVAAVFTHFLTNLVSAQAFFVKPVMLMLVRNLCYKHGMRGMMPPEQAEVARVHVAIREVLRVVPLAGKQQLVEEVQSNMPYNLVPAPAIYSNYLECVFTMLTYLPEHEDRLQLLRFVVKRLVNLDACLPKFADNNEDDKSGTEEGIFQFDAAVPAPPVSKAAKDLKLATCNFDQAMVKFFQYIQDQHANGKALELFTMLLDPFESFVMSTYNTGHVQYTMFYLLSLEPSLTANFIDWLWKRFTNPNTASVFRQSAMAYIASLISRAKFVDLQCALTVLDRICRWIHSYLANRNKNSSVKRDFVDVKAHGPFYSACQSALYIIAFRHTEIMEREQELMPFLVSLNFNTIVTSPLNPLRVILPPVVEEFSRVSRQFQLAYCETIIERNNRLNLPVVGGSLSSMSTSGTTSCVEKPLLLDSYFPFDPYKLQDSCRFITEHYREYQGPLESDEEDDDSDEERMDEGDNSLVEDSFMAEVKAESMPKAGACNALASALLGTSPGFRVYK